MVGLFLKHIITQKKKVAELIDGGNMSSCWSDSEFDYEKEFVKHDPQPEYYGGKMKDPDSVRTSLSSHLIQKMEKSSCISLDLMAMSGKHLVSITNMMMTTPF